VNGISSWRRTGNQPFNASISNLYLFSFHYIFEIIVLDAGITYNPKKWLYFFIRYYAERKQLRKDKENQRKKDKANEDESARAWKQIKEREKR
jgi:hypothetical protein